MRSFQTFSRLRQLMKRPKKHRLPLRVAVAEVASPGHRPGELITAVARGSPRRAESSSLLGQTARDGKLTRPGRDTAAPMARGSGARCSVTSAEGRSPAPGRVQHGTYQWCSRAIPDDGRQLPCEQPCSTRGDPSRQLPAARLAYVCSGCKAHKQVLEVREPRRLLGQPPQDHQRAFTVDDGWKPG